MSRKRWAKNLYLFVYMYKEQEKSLFFVYPLYVPEISLYYTQIKNSTVWFANE